MAYTNPYLPQYQTPVYQTPVYQQPQAQVYQQQLPSIDWDAVAKACQTLAAAAANVPAGTAEYATKADLERLKQEIIEGVKSGAKPAV